MIGPKAVIHIGNLLSNYRNIKKHVGDVPLMTVVKANAYGHGVKPIAQALQEEGVTHFAVFTFEEAVELRDNGIKGEILVFSRINKQYVEQAADLNITLNLSQKEDINILNKVYKKIVGE